MKYVLLAAVALSVSGTADAAAFVNGSFETGPEVSSFTQLENGDTSIAGWTVTKGSIDYIGDYWKASSGGYSLDLSGGDAGTIAQTFDTIAGRSYRVTYDLAGNPDGGDAIKRLSVLASGTGNVADEQTFDTAGRDRGAMGWSQRSYDFRAGAAATTLTFAALTGGAYGPALDNVSLTLLGAAVPEPATWAMMIGGVGLVGGAARRRRKAPAFA